MDVTPYSFEVSRTGSYRGLLGFPSWGLRDFTGVRGKQRQKTGEERGGFEIGSKVSRIVKGLPGSVKIEDLDVRLTSGNPKQGVDVLYPNQRVSRLERRFSI